MDADAIATIPRFLSGGGEMGALMRGHGWAATPLGAPDTWPQPLKTCVRLMLNSRHPMFIWWGDELTCFYNDAYSTALGPDRHPSALGRPGRAVWAEIWDVIGPDVELVMAGRGATWHERRLIPITRGDIREDVWWTYGYSPIDLDGAPSNVGGVLVVCRDVSAGIRAELAQADEAHRLRQLFEQAPGFITLLRGPAHVFELTNAAYRSLIGRDVLGKKLREAVPEVGEQGYFDLLDRVYATGETFVARRTPIMLASGPDGALRKRILDFVYQPIRDAEGMVTGIFVEGSDVTEAALAEEALRDSEARQALLLRLARTQRETNDPDAMMRAASEAVGRHLGANRVGFFAMPDDDTLSFTVGWTDGGLDLLTGTFPAAGIGHAYLAAVRRGVVLGIADVTRDPLTADSAFAGIGTRASIGVPIIRDGRWRAGMYVNHAAVRHWTDEEVALAREVAEQTWDAVERARAEAALRELNETLEARVAARAAERNRLWSTTSLLFATAAFDSTIREVNPAWPALLGWSEAELVGRSYGEFVYPDDVERSLAWAAKLAAGEDVADLENRYRRKDGSFRWIAWAITAEDGVFHCVGRDVTDQRRQADALAAAEAALRQSQKMEAVGQLTGGIAHDFNNLLQGIVSALGLMKGRLDQGRTDELARFADMATASARRAATLTQRLLAFARRQPLDPKPVEVALLIASVEELLRRTLGPAIELKLLLPADLWLALCDVNQLENALLNLGINARDAMPDGGSLTVSAANVELGDGDGRAGGEGVRAGQYVMIGVSDTGVGMPPEVMARVFEPFFTTKPMGQGTGLGLSMLHGFAKQSGGHVAVRSEAGRGTEIHVFLPRCFGEIGTDDRIEAPSAIGATRTGGTVLVVEDEAAIGALIAEALGDIGVRVLEAADGPAALRHLLGSGEIDVLVTDVGLPGPLNGRQLADAARARRPGLPVIFITGYAHNAALGIDAALEPGMELMVKPFALDALTDKVRGIMERAGV